MKLLLLLFAVSLGHPVLGQTNQHPIIHHLATTADVIAVARINDPKVWITSELVIMTGQSTALVERTLKGVELPSKITVQVVRHIDIETLALESPQAPIKTKNFPTTPASPTKFDRADDSASLDSADKVIVFLRRSKNGDLSAVDGFLYTLPYSPELESAISSAAKNQEAQQDAP